MTETNKHNERTQLPFKESHAFIIGIDKYQRLSKLRTAVNDAKKLAEILTQPHKYIVHPPLINPSRQDILHLLKKTIKEKVKEEDRCLFYFAGHGIAMDSDDKPMGYIMPADAVRGDVKSFISMGDLYGAIDKLPCKHLLVILDCCFAGAFKWATRFRYPGVLMPKRIYKERFDRYIIDPAWQVITSAASDQEAWDFDHSDFDIFEKIVIGKRDTKEMIHSPFALALFKGLAGAADLIPRGEGDGVITASELYLYLRDQVEPKTIKNNERLRQTPGIFPLEKHDKGEYIFLNRNHRLNLPPIPGRNPYKGLESFEEKDKELFYGRERVIKDLMQKIDENNLIVVSGASGTGKSSVVKAGLLPELRRKDYTILPVIRPGKEPLAALEKALHESKLFNGNMSPINEINSISEKLIMDSTVLVIDQYEELITQCKKKEDRDRFIDVLKRFLDSNNSNHFKIIITIRADFEPQFESSVLENYWKEGRYTVPSFTTEELREVIIKPVIQEVLDIEPPGLVDMMIDEVIQAPGALPLLSFALSELYRLYIESGRQDRALHVDDYKDMRGVVGALRTRADKFYQDYNLQPQYQETIRKIMLRLVSFEIGELAGKRVLMEELVFSEKEKDRVKTIIDQLLAARLLMKGMGTNNQVYIEPAHDALINAWATLWDWIRSYGEDRILLQNRLSEAAKDYAANKDKSYLWRDNPRLALFKQELKSSKYLLNESEKSFIKASIKFKRQKIKKIVIVSMFIITVLSVLSLLAISKANEANQKAKTVKSNQQASLARLKLKNDPMKAIRLAENAYKLDKLNSNAVRILCDAAVETLDHPFYNASMTHSGPVNDVIFSPSGRTILTASSDKTARLWDLQGNNLAIYQHTGVVYSARFSPEGTRILTVSREKNARLWNLSGTLLHRFTHHRLVKSAVFSPANKFILTASEDKTARLWNYSGDLINEYIHERPVNTAEFSPDGTRILTVSDDKIARLWDLQGRKIQNFERVLSAGFSPKGEHIIAVSLGNTIKIWSLDGHILKILKNLPRMVKYTTFSADGSGILIAYMKGAVELWDLHGLSIVKLKGHRDEILSAVFSPDSTGILTTSRDNTAKLWDTSGIIDANFDAHKDTVTSAVFSPDGTRIATASRDNTAKLWDLQNQPVIDFKGHGDAVEYAVFSPDGTRVLSVSADKTVKLWDTRGNNTATLDGHTKIINTAAFSPDGTKILTASADNTARLWDLDGKLLVDFNTHTANVNSAEFSPDGQLILTASFDNTAKLWDIQGNLLKDFNVHTEYVNFAKFSPDGRFILTVSFDNTVKLWNLQGELVTDFNINDKLVFIAVFSPDSTKILTVYLNSCFIRVWDLNGQLLAKFKAHDERITSAVFSPDGNSILTASQDKTVKQLNLEGKLLTYFNRHRGIVNSAIYSPGGTQILTASADGTAKMLDSNGNLLADFNLHKGVVYSAVFSPGGTRILTASADHTVKLCYTPEAIIQWLKTTKIPPLHRKETNLR